MKNSKLLKNTGMIAVVMIASSFTFASATETLREMALKSMPVSEVSKQRPLICEPFPECIFPRPGKQNKKVKETQKDDKPETL